MTDDLSPSQLNRPDGETIAYHHSPGEGTGLLWLGGFRSDMDGTKALALEEWARAAGRPTTRFDYFGHGQSSGDFRQGTISRWREDALAVLDEVTSGGQILIGSSMGGWVTILAALARPERVAGIVFIAPAPDFTEDLMWADFPEEVRAEIEQKGEWLQPSDYGFEPSPITDALIKDGRSNLVLDKEINLSCPVRILQGMKDPDVPWQHALRLVEALASADVSLHLIKHGDHRLSEPQNIARLVDTVETLAWEIEA